MGRMWNPSSLRTATPATVRISKRAACGWTRYEALMRGGKHGPAIKAGNTKASELLRRVTLSSSDDDAMPPQGKRPLAANEIKLLELWIAAGASSTLAANGIKDAPTNEVPVVAEVTFPGDRSSRGYAIARPSRPRG